MAYRRRTYLLSNDNIDLISDTALAEMEAAGTAPEHQLKTRLSLDEALLRMQERYGEDTEVTVSTGRRLGRFNIEVRLKGKAFNPLRFSESEFEEWNQMLSFADYQPDYQYTGHTNLIRWSAPLRKRHPAVVYGIAIILGLAVGVILSQMSPESRLMSILVAVLAPVEEVWIRILNVLCGPVTFLLLITTVLNMDKITRQGDSTGRFLMRVFRTSFIAAGAAVIASAIAFPLVKFAGFSNTGSDFAFLLLELVPEDVVSPFTSSNVPQLLILGVVIGSAIIASGKKYPVISAFIHEANDLSIRITEGVSGLAPYFLCVLLIYEIISRTTDVLVNIWQPVAVFLIVTAGLMLFFTIITARIEKLNALTLVRALKGPFIKTLSSGSTDPVIDYTLRDCRRRLGIDSGYAEVALSIGLIMYMPISVIGTLIFVVYSANMYGISATFMWYVIAAVISVAMCIAVPPVPGVGILTYVVMFAQLGIPKKALIAAMVFDVLTTVVISAANQYMLQLELILSADRMAMLDHEVLKKLSLSREKKN